MTKQRFHNEFVKAVKASGLTVHQFAGEMRTSGRTVSRWLNGEAAPHRLVRQRTLDFAQRIARDTA